MCQQQLQAASGEWEIAPRGLRATLDKRIPSAHRPVPQVSKDDPMHIKGQPGREPPSLWQKRTADERERFWSRTYQHLFVEGAPKRRSEVDRFVL